MNQPVNHLANCKDCDSPQYTRGLCRSHYQRARYSGELEMRKRDPVRSFLVRLLINIKTRCENPKVSKYQYYGGKGIKNELTLDDLRFLYERDNAHLLSRPSIDRKDSTKDYSIDNCRFIEYAENCRNRTYSITAKCSDCGKIEKGCNSRCDECRKNFQDNFPCKTCGKAFQQTGRARVCPECRTATRPCEYCGKPVTRDITAMASTLKNKFWFCSKTEQGKWTGERRYKKAA